MLGLLGIFGALAAGVVADSVISAFAGRDASMDEVDDNGAMTADGTAGAGDAGSAESGGSLLDWATGDA